MAGNGNTYHAFFTQVLEGLGLPVTRANLVSFMSVAHREGLNNYYNPVNSVVSEPGSKDFNSVGVQEYPDFETGVQGVIAVLSNSHWSDLRATLSHGNSLAANLSAWERAYTWAPGIQIDANASGLTNSLGDKTGTTPAGGGTNFGNPDLSRSDYEHALGDIGSVITSIPNLKKILLKAISGDWGKSKFVNAVQNSDWYQTHSATARSLIAQRISDPATYQQTLNNTIGAVHQIANQAGLDLTPGEASKIATHALMTGNDGNQQWITEQLAHKQDYSDLSSVDNLQGQMAANTDQLQQLAAQYGKTYDPSKLAEHALHMVTGHQSLDSYRQDLIGYAKAAFPSLSKQLDAGDTVADVASPYVSSMSNLLELNPQSLGVNTPQIRQALQGQSDGKSDTPALTPVWAFEQSLRNDPRWATTDNAHAETASMLTSLGQEWGFAA